MRGKRSSRRSCSLNSRITPARAGKTAPAEASSGSPADHPRACGENVKIDSARLINPGSPPRVRGKPSCAHLLCYPHRITPARAGKTDRLPNDRRRDRDHPRACGENRSSCAFTFAVSGSPPRVRGKHTEVRLTGVLYGITPARAGKTRGALPRTAANADHPRACGENAGRLVVLWPSVGSPPRVRGKPKRRRSCARRSRITPARAGKTSTSRLLRKCPKDHPRACGENALPSERPLFAQGSPPRVRGKLLFGWQTHYFCRITPARAGKTRRRRCRGRRRKDHPRACGENTVRRVVGSANQGSPPRVRGKHAISEGGRV